MRYRRFGKLGFQVSALGFGCMRLPTTEAGAIDEPHATRMLHYALDHGVNYLDSGYGYHGGQSEVFLGKALQGGLRQRVKVATKLPPQRVQQPEDMDRILNEQLQRLQTDHIDVYLLHGLSKGRWDVIYPMGITRWLERILADGRVGALGFSFHDDVGFFKTVVDAFDGWHMCQFQYNYMNETYQAGTEGLLYAASKGLAVVVMEPLLGGKLAKAPEAVQKLWQTAQARRTPAEWGLQWVWNHPQVSVALSGMSSMQQMIENVDSVDRLSETPLTPAELQLVGQVRDTYRSLSPSPCTSCGYCMPCPNGVDIPRSFSLLNAGVVYDLADARRRYVRLRPEQSATILASSCVQCRECESKCPQHIPISEWMPTVHAVLGENKPYEPRNA